MLYFGLDVQLRRGSVAGYTTDESWAYGPKEGVEAFESITFFIRFIYAINFEHLLNTFIEYQMQSYSFFCMSRKHIHNFSCFILLFEIKQTVVNIASWMYFIVSY